jgi:WS/DGAT/MGAT family acyltransferase
VCSGALRRYLDEFDQLPDRSLIAAVPFALPHDESEKTGNAVSGLNANLGTNIADVRKRFDAIRRSTEAGKSHLRKMTAVAAQRYMLFMAAPVMLTTLPGLGGQLRPTFNLVITNVPGPKKRLYFHGARMESFYPVIQAGQGLALNIGLISYADRLFFGPIACPDTVPDLDKLAAYMADALDELELAYGIATPGKSSKRVGRSQHKKRTARTPSKKK